MRTPWIHTAAFAFAFALAFAFASVFAVAVAGCTGSTTTTPSGPPGTEGGLCRDDETCDPGLFCDTTDCGLNPPFIPCDPTELCRACNPRACPATDAGEGEGEGEGAGQ